MLLNEGLLCMSKSDYAAARDAFQAATASGNDEEALAAENNLAVCKFYTKARASRYDPVLQVGSHPKWCGPKT